MFVEMKKWQSVLCFMLTSSHVLTIQPHCQESYGKLHHRELSVIQMQGTKLQLAQVANQGICEAMALSHSIAICEYIHMPLLLYCSFHGWPTAVAKLENCSYQRLVNCSCRACWTRFAMHGGLELPCFKRGTYMS